MSGHNAAARHAGSARPRRRLGIVAVQSVAVLALAAHGVRDR
jgi:hypothetical protein